MLSGVDSASETIRAFVAIELPEQVRKVLAGLVDQLNAADLRGVRIVRPAGIHLTLKFLGDVPTARVDSIVSALARAAEGHQPFVLNLGAAGVFPNRSRARVLWVGVDGDLERLSSLQEQVERELRAAGFVHEMRDFNPHLTLGRIRDGASSSDKRRVLDALFAADFDTGQPIDVEYVSLMSSTLLPQGAVHERVSRLKVGR